MFDLIKMGYSFNDKMNVKITSHIYDVDLIKQCLDPVLFNIFKNCVWKRIFSVALCWHQKNTQFSNQEYALLYDFIVSLLPHILL